ncbi:MAG TPA: hypothetical protein PKD75_01515 [Tepidiformaceae bacterium]|nr:hypothetical protein [Tepidiformaceae bacterium]
MTPNPCNQTTPSGNPCHHLAARCPYHPKSQPQPEPGPGPEPATETGAETPARPERPDPHRFVYQALQDAVEGRASPTAVTRLVKTLEVAHRLGPPPVDEEQMHAEIALRGMIMHGLAPYTTEQWELARDLFTPGALHMFSRWLAPWQPRPPEWLKDIPNPEDDLFHSLPDMPRPWDGPGPDNPIIDPTNPENVGLPIGYTMDPFTRTPTPGDGWHPDPATASSFDPNEPPLPFINPPGDDDLQP